MKLKVVIDHSVYVAAALSKDGASAAVFELAIKGDIINYVSDDILEELKNVLSRPKFQLNAQVIQSFLALTKRISTKAAPLKSVHICRDPHDNKFLAVALQVKANYIVTLDQDLLVLTKHARTRIIVPRELLRVITK
jgi:putative PIN family toxin of toxin-antitoxin system